MAGDDRTSAAIQRSLRSFPARLSYQPGPQMPPHVADVAGTADIHAHAHEGQQDALAVARLASVSGMAGLLFKTIVGRPGRGGGGTDRGACGVVRQRKRAPGRLPGRRHPGYHGRIDPL